MYIRKIICALILYTSTSAAVYSTNDKDSLGLPGDNLDLYGVLDLFQKSATPEAFETALNAKDNGVNNLDLDKDGYIDYIKVVDHQDKYAHALSLQVDINDKETQDVAVVEIEKNEDGSAHIQVIGDEALYGKNYIIEPTDNKEAAPQQQAQSQSTDSYYAPAPNPEPSVMVNVWGWPMISYMYSPGYVMWASPWRWSHYPGWWAPWRPIFWGSYWGNMYHYHYWHQRVFTNHMIYAHNVYHQYRSYSPTIYRNRSDLYRTRAVDRVRSMPQSSMNHPRGREQYPVQHNLQRNGQNANQVRRSPQQPAQNPRANAGGNPNQHINSGAHMGPRSTMGSSHPQNAVRSNGGGQIRSGGGGGHSGGGGGGHSGGGGGHSGGGGHHGGR